MDKKPNLICNLVWKNNIPNISREKKSGKLIIRDIFLSPRAITV
jgi:hypothetical protein